MEKEEVKEVTVLETYLLMEGDKVVAFRFLIWDGMDDQTKNVIIPFPVATKTKGGYHDS